jgi:uncharacterized protein
MNHNSLNGKLNIAKLPLNTTQEYHLNKDSQWVQELLAELNENATTKDTSDYLHDSFLNIDLKITKKFKGSLGEYILVEGKVDTEYFTECIRTLDEMTEELEFEFRAAFIDDVHEDEPEYHEETEIYLENDMYELYFYKNRTANLKEMVHELIYLYINQYPIKDAATPLNTDIQMGGTLQ